MRIHLFRLPSVAVLAAACLFAQPASLRAENAFSKFGNRIKEGASKVATAVSPRNVSSAVKKTAQAAKSMVTTGSTKTERSAPAPVPRAILVKEKESKPQRAKPERATAAVVTKPKRPVPKPQKEKEQPVVARTKQKTPERKTSSTASTSASASKKRVGDYDNTPAVAEVKTISTEVIPAADITEENGPLAPETIPAMAKPEPPVFGTPAFGRRGFVYSPFAPEQGMIDVTDIAAGTKVRCPYTQKVFRVP